MAITPDTTGAEKISKFDNTSNHNDQPSVKFDGADTHTTDHPNPKYIESVKAHLSKGLSGDDKIGDAGTDGTYKGQSMELGKGGRSFMMVDRITLELVNKGYKFDQAMSIAKKQAFQNGLKKYGNEKMKEWSQPKMTETKIAK